MTARTSISRNFRISVTAAVFIAALTLSACSGGESPGGNGTPSSSASGSASPTATPTPAPTAVYKPADANGKAQNVPLPELPDAAKAETKEGLEAFAKYWYAALSYAFETGDTKPISAITSESCNTCGRQVSLLSDWYKSGGWVEGAGFEVDVAQSTFQPTDAQQYQVVIQLRQLEGTFYKSDGATGNSQTTTDFFGDIMIASYNSGQWVAKTVERVGGQG